MSDDGGLITRPPFRDTRLPVRTRVADLLARLTLDERIAMLHQFAPGVERLGLAPFRTGQEALHGVAWMGPATVFPQAVGLGATWNPELVRRVGEAVGREARAMRARDPRVGLNVWSPTVNLLRDPRWGRNEEGYAEDPCLTSALATAYARGLRGDHPERWRTAPVLKHWLAHNNETDRDTTSSSVRPRVLHEYDLAAFRGAVRSGAVAGVMPAYNLVNGRPNHVSPYLREQLRTWTDQELVVCSDAGAPSNLVDSEHYFDTHEEAIAAALLAGVDSFTDHDQDASKTIARVRGALERGLIDASTVDTAVRRLLTMRCALGEFDECDEPEEPEEPDQPGGSADGTDGAFDTPAHRALALEAAEQAVVLLANDGLLPLSDSGVRTLAVVGPLADECKLDWYSGSLIRRSSPREALAERLGADRVVFAEGLDTVRLRTAAGWVRVPDAAAEGEGPAEEGLADEGPTDERPTDEGPTDEGPTGEGPADEGSLNPAHAAGRTDLPTLTVGDTPTDLSLADWGGGVLTLRAPSGRYLTVADDGFVRAAAERPGGWVVQETFTLEAHRDGHLLRHMGTGGYVCVAAGALKVAERDSGAEGTVFGLEVVERGEDAVARAAARADAVVVVAGNDPHIGGRETEDRTTLALPAQQERLWRAAHAANPRTALVLTSSYPYAVGEAADALPALLWTAHGGQAAGTALARVLFGDVSPAGRLPQSWYASHDDLPDLLDYDIIASRATYLYFDGTPLFPFGHGLSYTDFSYGELSVRREAGLTVECEIANSGPYDGDEVVQIYASAPGSRVPLPHRRLIAHRRVRLRRGERVRLFFTVPVEDALGFWDVAHGRWTVDPGTYEIHAGASSADLRATATVTVEGPPPAPRPVLRRGLEAADYDAADGIVLVDRTKVRGDAVACRDDAVGRLLFRACDFGTGATSLTIEAARDAAAAGAGDDATVEAHLADGTTLATAAVPPTGGRYAYTTVRAALPTPPTGVQDLHITLRGGLRLARLGFSG
ncbi:glycoside hydrolase family 3 C-terminal domain-containing protein [Streptomyces sp. NEAU-YJ-81]|uniref:glycoside hydrolase family 3 C-terminal domain-containing protein n=1 Tax=Streptomyces sp. NEAU-YJ-81 TaxID=2820288 RepID=UPI001ABC8FF0|nr:glycoside hydrolase family 3 C-terminal domain-containing protein [Streptomyces sp. NEAU-YJ-81]MBO3676872.1 glycoside hydrolase family 3 C-terminal domain-containing protein [Streptomyces sp. NEAU-YJ-81]